MQLESETFKLLRRRIFVEFIDDKGNIKKGVMKSNDGHCCKVLVGTHSYIVSRKQIKFIKG